MKNELYVHIPEPCHENWENMSPETQGRFCQSCAKTVIDFSSMTDQEVLQYFARQQGSTCGRFANDQLERALQPTRVSSKKNWKWLVASLVTMIVSVRSHAQKAVQGKKEVALEQLLQTGEVVIRRSAETRGPDTARRKPTAMIIAEKRPVQIPEAPAGPFTGFVYGPMPETIVLGKVSVVGTKAPSSSTIDSAKSQPAKLIRIHGVITDETGQPLAGIYVSLDAKDGDFTNEKGEYSISICNRGTHSIVIADARYESKKLTIASGESKSTDIILTSKVNELPAVTIIGHQSTRRNLLMGDVTVGLYQVTPRDTLFSRIMRELRNPVVYPNPAQRGQEIQVLPGQPGRYTIQLFDNNSKMLRVQEGSVEAKTQSIPIQIPASIAPGYYYIRVVSRETEKVITDKILVH